MLNRVKVAAQMGIWEVDLEKQTLIWSDVTRQIHEVEEDYNPTLEEGINFFREGKSRDLIREVYTKALNEGKNYDVEVQTQNSKRKYYLDKSDRDK